MKKHLKKIGAFLMAVLFAVGGLVPMTTSATPRVDTEAEGSITINYSVPESTFHIYKVASMLANTKFTMDDTFASYYEDPDAAVNDLESSDYTDLAETIKGYIDKDGIEADYTGTSDDKGVLEVKEFGEGKKINPGLYLIVKDKKVLTDGIKTTLDYTAYNIISVPSYDEENDDWNYDVNASMKTAPEQTTFTKLKVTKQWNYGSSNEKSVVKSYPKKEITVKLLVNKKSYVDSKGEKPYDSIKLNAKNNWTAELTDLELKEGDEWQFVEVSKVSGYNPSVSKDAKTGVTIITNKYTPPNTSKTTTGTTGTKKKKLPQTGQLWWPVPILVAIGLFIFLIGAAKNKMYNKNKK